MCTISLRSRSRNEIFISKFKGFVLLLPTQTFFYFMAIEVLYKCELDKNTYLQTDIENNKIKIMITENEITNAVILTKYDVKKLIEELNEWINL